MRKLTQPEAVDYWRTVHNQSSGDLEAVCFPDRPRAFNRFFDWMQRSAVDRCLRRAGLSVREKSVLDLGCGRGRWLAFYAARGARVVGVDVSLDAVEACRRRGYAVVPGSVDNLPFENGSFDWVNSITVLQHIPPGSQARAVLEIQRVLRPGGHVLLLENTSADHSWHVWGTPLASWAERFDRSQRLSAENHYFVPLFRALWGIPAIGGRQRLRNLLELLVLPAAYVAEYGLMQIRCGKPGSFGLQHVMLFQKSTEDVLGATEGRCSRRV